MWPISVMVPLSRSAGTLSAKKLTSVIWCSDLDDGFGERPFAFAAFLAALDLEGECLSGIRDNHLQQSCFGG